jgi:anti-sigma regulatory factor (Ser/Thr protein kinase)
MSAEPAANPSSAAPGARTSRIECNLDNDPRLLASVETIVAHAAGRAGFPEDAQREVAVAAASASREMAVSANGSAPATMRLIVDEFPDRLELTFESPGGPNPEGMRKRLEGNTNDRIRCEPREGGVRLTLLKSCGAAKSGSAC